MSQPLAMIQVYLVVYVAVSQPAHWGPWLSNESCTKACGGGNLSWYRECNNPPPTDTADYCNGSSQKLTTCNNDACPEDFGKKYYIFGSSILACHCFLK